MLPPSKIAQTIRGILLAPLLHALLRHRLVFGEASSNRNGLKKHSYKVCASKHPTCTQAAGLP